TRRTGHLLDPAGGQSLWAGLGRNPAVQKRRLHLVLATRRKAHRRLVEQADEAFGKAFRRVIAPLLVLALVLLIAGCGGGAGDGGTRTNAGTTFANASASQARRPSPYRPEGKLVADSGF